MRQLTPQEINFLNKYNYQNIDLEEYGEMPVEYIVGQCEFLNRDFYVNRNVLIPRIETEELIKMILDNYPKAPYLRFLDMGTGSGAIGITLFLEFLNKGTSSECVLADISQEALNVCTQNKEKLIPIQFTKDVEVLKSDLFDNVKGKPFDFIIANLPYVPFPRYLNLEPSVKDFEPYIALEGGVDGALVIKRFIRQVIASDKLVKDGKIFLEIDDTHDENTFAEFSQLDTQIFKDSFGKNRFAVLRFK